MDKIDPRSCRAETLLGALLYLMTLYQRHRCRNVACAIVAHLECLACHPDTGDAMQEMAEGLVVEWRRAATGSSPNTPVGVRKRPIVLN
jgi:hypothetical protein